MLLIQQLNNVPQQSEKFMNFQKFRDAVSAQINHMASQRNAKAAQKKKLLSLLAEKQDEELASKTPEELQEMIDAL